MTPYWMIFALPLLGVLMPVRLAPDARRLVWLAFSMLLIFIAGFRFEIGGDWEPYIEIYEDVRQRDLVDGLGGGFRSADPGYAFLNWVSARLDWGIYGVNVLCGSIFVLGFNAFARRQPIPWLAWVIAIPYLFTVVVMGYSRQGVALGIVFWALNSLERQAVWRFVLGVAIAALFHKAAALLMPFAFVVGAGRRSALQIVGLLVAIPVAAIAFLAAQYEHLWTHYVEDPQTSQGAAVRVLMNVVPAALMLVIGRQWRARWPDPGHWRAIAWTSIACLLVVGVASTAVDRVALFLAPIQVYVWCRYPLLYQDRAMRAGVAVAICAVYAAAMWVFLTMGVHAAYWVPYRNALFE